MIRTVYTSFLFCSAHIHFFLLLVYISLLFSLSLFLLLLLLSLLKIQPHTARTRHFRFSFLFSKSCSLCSYQQKISWGSLIFFHHMEREFFGLSSKNGAWTTMKDDAVNKSRDQGSIFPPFLLLLFCFYIKKKLCTSRVHMNLKVLH